MIQMDKNQIGKIRIEIALGKTYEQVANEFNIPLTRYKKIPRIYPRKAIVRLLFQYNNEKIAQIAQIPVEIVEQIRQEQKQNEALLRIHSALGTPHEQIAKELEVAFSTVSGRKREIKNLYSREMIIDLLKSQDDAEIAELAQVPIEIVEQIREEEQKKEEELRDLIVLGLTLEEIATRWNLTRQTILNRKKALGKVYTRKEIEQLLEEKDDTQIATLAQISKEIVGQIRQERAAPIKEKSIIDLTIGEERTIRNLVALGIEECEIARLLHYNKISIKRIKFHLGIYSRVQVIKLLKDYSDEEISDIASINIETVQRIRQEMENETKRNSVAQKDNVNSNIEEIRDMTAQGVTLEEIADILGMRILDIGCMKRKFGVYSQIQILKLLEIKEKDEVANITGVDVRIIEDIVEEKHRANQLLRKKCKENLQQLNGKIKFLKEGDIPKKVQNGIKGEILKLLRNYKTVLTPVDYSFIAYIYLKMGMKQQCQEISYKYLGVKSFSMKEIVKRIGEILTNEGFSEQGTDILTFSNDNEDIRGIR